MLDPTAERLARLVADLTDADSLNATVDQIVRFARDTIGADHAGITLLLARRAGFETVGHTDRLVLDVDDMQYQLGEGPCIDAAIKGQTVRAVDLDADPRWPRWGPSALNVGLRSIVSIQLHARGSRVGALNLYGERSGQFDDEDVQLARLFAYHAASALAVARNEEQLLQALDTRTAIGQAQGILMERFDLDAERAFNVMRRYSQDHNVKLYDVARTIVLKRVLPEIPSANKRPPSSS